MSAVINESSKIALEYVLRCDCSTKVSFTLGARALCPGTGAKLCVVQTSVRSFECVFTFGAQYLVRTFKLSRISGCIEGTCIS